MRELRILFSIIAIPIGVIHIFCIKRIFNEENYPFDWSLNNYLLAGLLATITIGLIITIAPRDKAYFAILSGIPVFLTIVGILFISDSDPLLIELGISLALWAPCVMYGSILGAFASSMLRRRRGVRRSKAELY